MNAFAKLPAKERNLYFQQYQGTQGIDALIVEKDFWVCWMLGLLFRAKPFSEHCVFKGGTSLSKAFNAIHRFSEDIDLSLSPELLGWSDETLEADDLTSTRRERLNKDLQAACAQLVEVQLLPALEREVRAILGEPERDANWLSYESDENSKSPVLQFRYPSQRPSKDTAYILPQVKLEFGSLTDQKPLGAHSVTAMVDQLSPGRFADCQAPVVALELERTFWEKATILHAEHHRPTPRSRDRYSRHYADFAALWHSPQGQAAAQNLALLQQVVRHKSRFFRSSWANYQTAKPGTLRLVPQLDQIANLKKDYRSMEPMFFRPPPPFERVLETLEIAENALNR